MKFFVCITLLVAVYASCAKADTATSSGASVHEAEPEQNAPSSSIYDLSRFRKAASYGGGAATLQAPPCPKNYLFSCQPSVAPVACAAPASQSFGSAGQSYGSAGQSYGSAGQSFGTAGQSYGSAGAYSAPIPYFAPVPAGYVGVGGYGGVNYGPVAYNPNQYYGY